MLGVDCYTTAGLKEVSDKLQHDCTFLQRLTP